MTGRGGYEPVIVDLRRPRDRDIAMESRLRRTWRSRASPADRSDL
jgi:hypothetical protein